MQYKNEQGEYYSGGSIVIGDTRYISPSEEILAQAGYYPELPPEPTEEDILEEAKQNKILEVENYDSTREVFTIDAQPMWLGHELRQQLKTSVEAYMAMGAENVTKWFGGQEFTFPCTIWLQMLAALEIYAAEVLNATERHKATINNLQTLQEVEEYDITDGYPQELNLSSTQLARGLQ